MSDFYIGYLSHAPAGVRSWIRRMILLALVITMLVAFGGIVWQQPFAAAHFEFGRTRTFEGTIERAPFPVLVVEHPGAAPPSRYLLVGRGKHGAGPEIIPHVGLRVRLQGTLLHRGSTTAIEVERGSVHRIEGVSRNQAAAPLLVGDRQQVTVRGEVVDSKCYLGVMNPGRGKVHRDCAARCLSGGTPPALITREGDLYLLAHSGGPSRQYEFARYAGELVEVKGVLAATDTRERVIEVQFISR